MICENCLYNKNCQFLLKHKTTDDVDGCTSFEDKSEWVHLPCKVGDTVYYLTGINKTLIKPAIIKEIVFDETGIKDLFVSSDICNFENSFDIFYLTREEGQKALAERMKKND